MQRKGGHTQTDSVEVSLLAFGPISRAPHKRKCPLGYPSYQRDSFLFCSLTPPLLFPALWMNVYDMWGWQCPFMELVECANKGSETEAWITVTWWVIKQPFWHYHCLNVHGVSESAVIYKHFSDADLKSEIFSVNCRKPLRKNHKEISPRKLWYQQCLTDISVFLIISTYISYFISVSFDLFSNMHLK